MKELIAHQSMQTSTKTVVQKVYRISSCEYEHITEEWIPKVSWFRPPRIDLFKWAYHYRDMKVLSDRPQTMILDDNGQYQEMKFGVTKFGGDD